MEEPFDVIVLLGEHDFAELDQEEIELRLVQREFLVLLGLIFVDAVEEQLLEHRKRDFG